ncbi:GFO-IDH-MocA domain-containing protein [Mycena kentingensis (nom. inval.)]|nr:GFO-IDH-MocA domain-containing protein [Mycena kentingensis (nom. inval.)]
MSPIRVAIIGLSTSAGTHWAAVAHLPYLLSPRGRSKYEIVALCNSSIDTARKAIAHFKLPDSVKAYGSAAELANDDNVDLVVVSTRVDVHYATAHAPLDKGRNVFCEWPLAENTERAGELVELAAERGVRTMIGLQAHAVPVSAKLREVIKSGRIGRVVSVEARGFGGLNSRDTAPTSLGYFFDRAVGGNVFVIGHGHDFDAIQSIVGELTDLKGNLHIQYPTKNLRGPDGTIEKTVTSNTADLIIVNGALQESETTQKDAPVSIRIRQGQQWPGEPCFVLSINGEKGELRVTAEGGMSLALAYSKPMTIQVHDFAADEVEEISWDWEDWQKELPVAARGIGALYEAYAAGEGYPTFADALKRHEQLDKIAEEFVAKHPL